MIRRIKPTGNETNPDGISRLDYCNFIPRVQTEKIGNIVTNVRIVERAIRTVAELSCEFTNEDNKIIFLGIFIEEYLEIKPLLEIVLLHIKNGEDKDEMYADFSGELRRQISQLETSDVLFRVLIETENPEYGIHGLCEKLWKTLCEIVDEYSYNFSS